MKRWIAQPPTLRVSIAGALTALIMIASTPPAQAAGAHTLLPTARKATHAKATHAKAAHAKAHVTRVRAAKVATTRGTFGMKAAIDPATGRLVRPTAEQVQALDAQSGIHQAAPDDDPARGITTERLANGATLARLDERFQEYEVARIGPDGKLVRDCVHGPEAAARFRKDAQTQAAAPAPKHEVQ